MKIVAIIYSCAVLGAAWGPASHAEEPAPPTAGPVIPAPHTPDGFTVVNNRVYFVRDEKMMPLNRDVTLKISPSGIITAFNGAEYAIPEGQVLTITAGVAPLPAVSEAAAMQIPPPLPGEIGGDTTSSPASKDTADATSHDSSFTDSSAPGADSSVIGSIDTTDSTFMDGLDSFELSVFPRHRIPGSHHGHRRSGMNVTSAIGTATNANGTTTNAIGTAGPNATFNNTGGNFTNPDGMPRTVNGPAPLSPSAVENQQNIRNQQSTPQSNVSPPSNSPATNGPTRDNSVPVTGFNETRATGTIGGGFRSTGGFTGGSGGMRGGGGGGHR
jgi:hypothetical protein